MEDKLEKMFERQIQFMEMLRLHDLIPEWPLDLTSKSGQRLIREMMHSMGEELFEASHTLKNKMHRLTDARLYDREHYREELGDALAYFLEICIMSGFSPEELYQEYCRKNSIVKERLLKGY